MSYKLDKWTDEELVENYREMQHLAVDVSTSKGIGDLALYEGLVREMARRFAILIENKAAAVDPIDRDELLKAMDTWDKFGYTTQYGLERLDKDDKNFVPYVKYDNMVNCVKGMSSVTPQPRWISVNDRLPPKGEYGDVLVTYVPPAGTLWATVMIARYSDLMGIAKPCFHIGEVGKESFENITPKVTAWMPLPQPYRQGE